MGLVDELQEAVDSIDAAPQAEDNNNWTDEEMAAFLEAHPQIAMLVAEGFDTDEVMEALDIGMMQLVEKGSGPTKGGGGGNPGNDPFATAPLHDTNSAGQGGGNPQGDVEKGNGRSRTGECTGCSCSSGKCTCTCNGKKRVIDMTDYYSSGRKAKYMKHWRVNHGPDHPR